jgi:hypothetical protein
MESTVVRTAASHAGIAAWRVVKISVVSKDATPEFSIVYEGCVD